MMEYSICLAIDSQDRWVVIEIKAGALGSRALGQAIYYAASLARLEADELFGKLKGGLARSETRRRCLQECGSFWTTKGRSGRSPYCSSARESIRDWSV